jgi:hypothetical protein
MHLEISSNAERIGVISTTGHRSPEKFGGVKVEKLKGKRMSCKPLRYRCFRASTFWNCSIRAQRAASIRQKKPGLASG